MIAVSVLIDLNSKFVAELSRVAAWKGLCCGQAAAMPAREFAAKALAAKAITAKAKAIAAKAKAIAAKAKAIAAKAIVSERARQ